MVLTNHPEVLPGEETEERQSWPRAASASGVCPVPWAGEGRYPLPSPYASGRVPHAYRAFTVSLLNTRLPDASAYRRERWWGRWGGRWLCSCHLSYTTSSLSPTGDIPESQVECGRDMGECSLREPGSRLHLMGNQVTVRRTEVDETLRWGALRNYAQYLFQAWVLGWFFIHLPKSQAGS